MNKKPQQLTDELVDKIAAHARSRLDARALAQIEPFLRQYYGPVAPEDLVHRSVIDLYGAAMAHWSLARERSRRSTS